MTHVALCRTSTTALGQAVRCRLSCCVEEIARSLCGRWKEEGESQKLKTERQPECRADSTADLRNDTRAGATWDRKPLECSEEEGDLPLEGSVRLLKCRL